MSFRLETDRQFEKLYREYISACNTVREHGPDSWALEPFLAQTVIHNDIPLTQQQYTALINTMIDRDAEFQIVQVVVDLGQAVVAARLDIMYPDGNPATEHVFYEWDREARVITRVWSMYKPAVREPEREE